MGGLVGGWLGFEVEIPPYTGVHTGGSRVSMASQNIYSFVYMCVCMCVCARVCVCMWVCGCVWVGWWVGGCVGGGDSTLHWCPHWWEQGECSFSESLLVCLYVCVCACVCVCVGGLVGGWVGGWWRFHLTLASTLVVVG